MLVPDVGGLERIELRFHRQHDIDDVREREIEGVGPVPAAPAEMISDRVLGDVPQRVIQRLDADHAVL